MNNRVCPRCNKSVGVIKLQEKDPKTQKYWSVEKCFKCHFNFELEEITRAVDNPQRPTNRSGNFGNDHRGWIV